MTTDTLRDEMLASGTTSTEDAAIFATSIDGTILTWNACSTRIEAERQTRVQLGGALGHGHLVGRPVPADG